MESPVVVYTAEEGLCEPCREVEQFLTRYRISFVRKEITQDPEALEEMLELTGGREPVPVVRVDRVVIVGYDPARLRDALGLWDTP